MRVGEFISEGHIVPELQAVTRDEAVAELTGLVFRTPLRVGQKESLGRVRSREMVESVGIGGGIAVLNVPSSGLTELVCAVGRAREGVDFGSMDNVPVHLVFLVCYPPDQLAVCRDFVAALADSLRGRDAVDEVRDTTTATEILQLLDVDEKLMTNPVERVSNTHEESAVDDPGRGEPATSEIVLLARLERCVDRLASAVSGQDDMRRCVKRIKAQLCPSTVMRFEQLKRRNRMAVVAVRGRSCQGCFMQVPKQFARELRTGDSRLSSCPHCSRFVYAV